MPAYKFPDGGFCLVVIFEARKDIPCHLCAKGRMTVKMSGAVFIERKTHGFCNIVQKRPKAQMQNRRNVFENGQTMLKNILIMAEMVLIKTFEHRKLRNEHRKDVVIFIKDFCGVFSANEF